MRIGQPLTPEQVRQEFERTLNGLSLKGTLVPSCSPFDDIVIVALNAIAMSYPRMTAGQIAQARTELERQLDGTHAREQEAEFERLLGG